MYYGKFKRKKTNKSKGKKIAGALTVVGGLIGLFLGYDKFNNNNKNEK